MNQVTPCFSSKSLMTQAAKQGGDFWCVFGNSQKENSLPTTIFQVLFGNYDETCSPYLFANYQRFKSAIFPKEGIDNWTHI